MTNNTEDFCNEQHTFTLSPRFGISFLTPPVFIPYFLAISLQYFDNMSELTSIFSGHKG